MINFYTLVYNATTWGVYNSELYGERVKYYSIKNLLKNYGTPEEVYIKSPGGPGHEGEWAPFYIALLYPDQGIFAEYTTSVILQGNDIMGCFDNAGIEFELYPPNNREKYFQGVNRPVGNNLYGFKPVEDVTEMTISQFSNSIINSTEGCIITKKEFWPTISP